MLLLIKPFVQQSSCYCYCFSLKLNTTEGCSFSITCCHLSRNLFKSALCLKCPIQLQLIVQRGVLLVPLEGGNEFTHISTMCLQLGKRNHLLFTVSYHYFVLANIEAVTLLRYLAMQLILINQLDNIIFPEGVDQFSFLQLILSPLVLFTVLSV